MSNLETKNEQIEALCIAVNVLREDLRRALDAIETAYNLLNVDLPIGPVWTSDEDSICEAGDVLEKALDALQHVDRDGGPE